MARKAHKNLKKLAIFDIDGTIFRSSLIIELVYALVDEGVLPKAVSNELEGYYAAWRNRKGSYDDFINKVVEVHSKYIRGVPIAKVNPVVKKMIRYHKDRVYRYTRDLIPQLKRKGFMLIALSGSPQYIVSKFVPHFGFDVAFGTEYIIENGRLTGGRRRENTRHNKVIALKEFIAEKKLNVDYKNSIAVGDTESDIEMLALVGHPIAFNPNRSFAEYAKHLGWKIVVERKDTIYEINDFGFL